LEWQSAKTLFPKRQNEAKGKSFWIPEPPLVISKMEDQPAFLERDKQFQAVIIKALGSGLYSYGFENKKTLSTSQVSNGWNDRAFAPL